MSDRPGEFGNRQWMALVDQLVAEFELEWSLQAAYRIEEFQPRADELAAERDVDPRELWKRLVTALIPVEMELRLKGNGLVSVEQYHQRFPDLREVVDRACKDLFEASNLATLSQPQKGTAPLPGTPFVLSEPAKRELPAELGVFSRLEFLGAGNFGQVYRAWDQSRQSEVALKFPSHDAAQDRHLWQAFINEASQAQNLEHPGIVKTYSLEAVDGWVFLVLQLVEGGTLGDAMRIDDSAREIAENVAMLAEALGYAHRQGVVHRDVKPDNILLDEDGNVYLADFGLALLDSRQLTDPDGKMGSPAFMSPEQVIGRTINLDGRTDIWSLGVVLYEWLTGRKPFPGRTREMIYEQIKTRDPRPPRSIREGIDPELERICLKCLEKRPSDRYLTGEDLAADLRSWLTAGPKSRLRSETGGSSRPVEIIPRGLRSFGPEDAEGFLELLPGMRHADGIPESIKFWERRIVEPVGPDYRVPIGVLFGPSGSGKSSFVRAGLLPRLGAGVVSVYVESTQADTEVRLLKALRRHFPNLPEDADLIELLAGIGEGRFQAGKKVLLVLDQFEQYLSRGGDFALSQLTNALCHCDGERLQAMLLVRDDFWLAMNRFSDTVDFDLREGDNLQNIDLFDKQHAAKVMKILAGTHFDADRGLQQQIDAEFVQEVVNELAADERVMCIRLAVFFEMFKSRPWTISELEKVRGSGGLGVWYLEDVLKTKVEPKQKSFVQKTKEVLNELLPPMGTDIRGSMKSKAQLCKACQLESQPLLFENLLDLLADELKLVSRTHPDITEGGSDQMSNKSTAELQWSSSDCHIQLTHDYLVPAIREWLGQTPEGKARQDLAAMAAYHDPRGPVRQFPSVLEWMNWRRLLRPDALSATEQEVMAAGRRNFFRQMGKGAFVVAGVAAIGLGFHAQQSWFAGRSALQKLVDADWSEIPDLIRTVGGYPGVRPLLNVNYKGEPQLKPIIKALARLQFDDSPADVSIVVDYLLEKNSRPASVFGCLSVLDGLSPGNRSIAIDLLLQRLDSAEPSATAEDFRALGGLAFLDGWERISRNKNQSTGSSPWQPYAELIASRLLQETASSREWVGLFGRLENDIRAILAEAAHQKIRAADPSPHLVRRMIHPILEWTPEAKKSAEVAKVILTDFSLDDSPEILRDLASVVAQESSDEFLAELQRELKQQNMPNASVFKDPGLNLTLEQEKCLVAESVWDWLVRNQPAHCLEFLGDRENLSIRSLCIHFVVQCIGLETLMDLYWNLRGSQGKTALQAVMLAICERLTTLDDPQEMSESPLVRQLKQATMTTLETEQDSGVLAAALLLAKRMGWAHEVREVNRGQVSQPRRGDVYFGPLGMPFAIMSVTLKNGDERMVGVSLTPVPVSTFYGVLCDRFVDDQRPVVVTELRDVALFCNKYSLLGSVDQVELAFDLDLPDEQSLFSMDPNRKGYRLMTDEEWAAIHNVEILGQDRSLSQYFGWFLQNSKGEELNSIGLLWPEVHGLFDIFGNAYESFVSPGAGDGVRFGGGQFIDSFRNFVPTVSSGLSQKSIRSMSARGNTPLPLGFRLVKTLSR